MGLFSQKIEPTSITANIDNATDYRQKEDNWDLIVQVIDVINRTETGPKEARKLLQQKLKSRNPHVQLLALSMIKALADNCGTKFHIQLVAKSFLEDIQALCTDSTIDEEVKNRTMEYLAVWSSAEEFSKNESLKPIRTLYSSLRGGKSSARFSVSSGQTRGAAGRGVVTPVIKVDKKQQLIDDIELAKNSAHMLSQAVTFSNPDDEDTSENPLIHEFNGKCREMHEVIMGYLSRDTTDPQQISTLIEVNQELLNAFKAYDDLTEQRNVVDATRVSETDAPLVEFSSNVSSSNARPIPASAYQPTRIAFGNSNAEPFDPFGDENEISEDAILPLQPTVVGNRKGKKRDTETVV